MEDDIRRNFAQNLKRLREKKELSQNELTQKLNFSQGYISRLESGDRDPSLATIIRIAEVLDTTPNMMLSTSADSAKGYQTPSRQAIAIAVRTLTKSVEQQDEIIRQQRQSMREINGRLDRLIERMGVREGDGS